MNKITVRFAAIYQLLGAIGIAASCACFIDNSYKPVIGYWRDILLLST